MGQCAGYGGTVSFRDPAVRAITGAALLGIAAVAALFVARLAWRDDERNLILNGSFANSTTGWAGWNADLAELGEEQGRRGVVRVTWGGESKSFSLYTLPKPLVALVPGSTYAASGSVFSSVRGRPLCLVLREWSTAETPIA